MKTTILAAALLAAAVGARAESATYVIDPAHTYATFEIGHMGTSTNRGRFDKKQGTVQFDRAGKTGSVDLTIDMDSIDTGFDPFTKHLKSDQIFDAAKYPTAHFVGNQFSFDGDKVSAVSGELTLHGQTHPITLKALNFNCYMSPMIKREVCGGDFEASLVRSQYGVDYGLQYGFPDSVRVVVQVEAIKQ